MQRKNFPANADIWHFRFHKKVLLPILIEQLRSGTYQFSPLQIITKTNGDSIALWSSQDALVLKMLTLVCQSILPTHNLCQHIKGHGGSKKSVQATHDRINSQQFHFVVRTDIKGYYANINKLQCLEQLAAYIHCPLMLNLLSQYLFYSVESGGNFHTPQKGIPRGCALSPLIAGFQLYCIDAYFSKQKQLRYVRYMDDFLILCRTRHHCRKAVKTLNQFFNYFGFKQHPNKTFIGNIGKGFDWLGYQFDQTGLIDISPRSKETYLNKLRKLYEQALAQADLTSNQNMAKVVAYINHWRRWARSGLQLSLQARIDRLTYAYASPWDDIIPAGIPTI